MAPHELQLESLVHHHHQGEALSWLLPAVLKKKIEYTSLHENHLKVALCFVTVDFIPSSRSWPKPAWTQCYEHGCRHAHHTKPWPTGHRTQQHLRAEWSSSWSWRPENAKCQQISNSIQWRKFFDETPRLYQLFSILHHSPLADCLSSAFRWSTSSGTTAPPTATPPNPLPNLC